LKIRIFALAKELDLDSKLLIDYCAKCGVQAKNVLASISPEERDQVVAYIRQLPKGSAGADARPSVITREETIPEAAKLTRPIRNMATMFARPQPGRARPPELPAESPAAPPELEEDSGIPDEPEPPASPAPPPVVETVAEAVAPVKAEVPKAEAPVAPAMRVGGPRFDSGRINKGPVATIPSRRAPAPATAPPPAAPPAATVPPAKSVPTPPVVTAQIAEPIVAEPASTLRQNEPPVDGDFPPDAPPPQSSPRQSSPKGVRPWGLPTSRGRCSAPIMSLPPELHDRCA